jgi:cytochrome d ubiquinol oxidase subunit I
MQTPSGYKIVIDGVETKAVVTDFWAMVFNPSAVDRLVHVILGCWLCGVFLVLSVSAYYILKKKYLSFARICMKIGLVSAAIVLNLQLLSADRTAEGVAKNQPAKLAAMEGVFKTEPYTPLYLFGWVDAKSEAVRGIKIPGLLSFLTYKEFKRPVPGLDSIPADEHPNVQIVFQSYHIMIAMWGLMVLACALGLFLHYKKILEKSRFALRFLMLSIAFPMIANQVGWVTAEAGRQPWVVWKLLKTSDGVSTNIVASQVVYSISMFVVIYILLFVLFIYLLDKKIKAGPSHEMEPDLATVYSNPFAESAKD